LRKKDDYTTLVDPVSLLAGHRARVVGVGPISGDYGQDELERADAWEEQTFLLKAQPDHLAQMALFKVNTGTECRRFAGYTGTGKLRFRN
jgi:hypothetical protein